jgi:hypothetical protein
LHTWQERLNDLPRRLNRPSVEAALLLCHALVVLPVMKKESMTSRAAKAFLKAQRSQ